jgi:hypothetical protein
LAGELFLGVRRPAALEAARGNRDRGGCGGGGGARSAGRASAAQRPADEPLGGAPGAR